MPNPTQRVIWTALPNGRTDESLRVTALASFRLVHDGPGVENLESWPDLLDWADRIRSAPFTIRFAGHATQATRVSTPDSEVWRALFPADTPVRAHAFEDRRGTRILSYPVTRIHDFVEQTYGRLALAEGDALPDKRKVLDVQLRSVADAFRTTGLTPIQDEFLEGASPWVLREGPGAIIDAFKLQAVYTMPMASVDPAIGSYQKRDADDPREDATWRQPRYVDLPDEGDLAQLVDFHARVSALNQFPRLLRLAGIAVDLEIPVRAWQGAPVSGPLALEVDWPVTPAATSHVKTLPDGLPETWTVLDDRRFEAATNRSSLPLSNGFLDLASRRYRLLQMDVDGAGIKLRNTAIGYLGSTLLDPENEESDPGGVPTLRTAGLQLVEIDKHLRLGDAFERSKEMNDGLPQENDAIDARQPIVLHAEDLVRGYHVDVIDHTRGTPWRSLCRRHGNYALLKDPDRSLSVEDEEGMVRLGAQEAADESAGAFEGVLKIGETLFAWSGWSLAAPRPGLAIGPDDDPKRADTVVPEGLPLQATFEARAGSLPTLRFGHQYRVRVRVADLAGNARPLIEDDVDIPDEASSAHTYRRYEPVPPPALALVIGPDDSPELPGYGESMSRIAIRSFNDREDTGRARTEAVARRHLVPPRTSHVLAEQHGMLDDERGRPDPALYEMLKDGDFDLGKVEERDDGPPAGAVEPVMYSAWPIDLVTPYLPDPFAGTAVLRFDSDPPTRRRTARVEVPYYDAESWPHARPFRLRIHEGDGAPTFDRQTRTVDVPLRKADVVRVRASHLLAPADLEQMAIWDMMRRQPQANLPLRELGARVERGEHWMLTPWAELELVHAVQKPLAPPVLVRIDAKRRFGEPTAKVLFESDAHANSTDKLELLGRWVEPCDVPAKGEPPSVQNASGSAFERSLSRESAEIVRVEAEGSHAFADTRYRRVAYRLQAPTRFREFLPTEIRDDRERTLVVSEERIALVPNAGLPPAPDIVEIVPTFGWTRSTTATAEASFRSGGGLRVWLRRPWFSTGFGEMLGVLVARPGATTQQITGALANVVTQWGADPIWRAGTVAQASPPLSAFPNRLLRGPIPADRSPDFVPDEERDLPNPLPRLTDLGLPEHDDVRVDVAAHPVQFDDERALYYCDIQMNPGSAYYPFVRLALARFQPVSVEGAHLSPVVVGDSMQLAPDRLLRLTRSLRRREIKLELFGHSYTRSPLGQEREQVEDGPAIRYELQRRNPDLTGDLAWQAVDFRDDPPALEPVRAAQALPVLQILPDEFTAPMPELARIDLDRLVQSRPPLMWEKTLPSPAIGAGEDWRVMVFEYERHSVDTDRPPRARDAADPALRLVYAAALPLGGPADG